MQLNPHLEKKKKKQVVKILYFDLRLVWSGWRNFRRKVKN